MLDADIIDATVIETSETAPRNGASKATAATGARRRAAAAKGQAEPAAIGPAASFTPANEVETNLLTAATTGQTDNFLSTLLLARVLVPIPTGEGAAQ